MRSPLGLALIAYCAWSSALPAQVADVCGGEGSPISGTVMSGSTPVAGADAFILSTLEGATTDESGCFTPSPRRFGSSMIRGMTLGPKADRAMGEAEALGPDNPRVWLLQGTSNLYKPRMFGGGVDKAREQLEKALALFESDDPVGPRPNWGQAEVHVWLGMAHMREEQYSEARAAFEAALALVPDYAWVTEVLLPQVDRAASGR